jgi:hypothetical protein
MFACKPENYPKWFSSKGNKDKNGEKERKNRRIKERRNK